MITSDVIKKGAEDVFGGIKLWFTDPAKAIYTATGKPVDMNKNISLDNLGKLPNSAAVQAKTIWGKLVSAITGPLLVPVIIIGIVAVLLFFFYKKIFR